MACRQKSDIRFLVDYLAFSFGRNSFDLDDLTEVETFEVLKAELKIDGLAYLSKRAWYGYNYNFNADGISVSFGGRDDIYVQFSGTGCRAFETLNPDFSWEEYIVFLQTKCGGLHFSRLDIACDTFDLLKIAKIQQAVLKGEYVSRWKTYSVVCGSAENVVYFGSTASDFRLRIYDKTLERQRVTGRDDVPDQWVRLEFQLRNKAAQSFLLSWQNSGDISDTFLGILRNQLNFYKFYDGKNSDRMILKPWWSRLLGSAEKKPMAYRGGMEYNLDTLKEYVVRQAGASIRTYVEIFGSVALGEEVMRRPLNDRQRALLASAEHTDLF